MITLEKKFRSVFLGKNFMTPNVEGYFEKGNYICELSSGDKFCGVYPFGVTVINAKKRTQCVEKGKSFCDRNKSRAKELAMEYIESLA